MQSERQKVVDSWTNQSVHVDKISLYLCSVYRKGRIYSAIKIEGILTREGMLNLNDSNILLVLFSKTNQKLFVFVCCLIF